MAQRNLSKSTERAARVAETLASGLRINRASDDAAGLAIADSLRATARVTAQAIRNVNDVVSLINIQQNGLESLRDISFRQKELAAQAANGTYSAVQREALHAEAMKLTDEYNRILDTTQFNGRKVLTNGQEIFSAQIGVGSENSLSFTVGSELAKAVRIEPGSYFTINSDDQSYYVWFSINGAGTDPGVSDRVGLRADLSSASPTTGEIATAVKSALDTTGEFTVTNSNGQLTVTNLSQGTAVDATDVNSGVVEVTVTTQGSQPPNLVVDGGNIDEASRVGIGDFNNDGISDIAVTNRVDNFVKIFFSDGDGTFTSGASYSTGSTPIGISVGDLNGDGRADFVTSNSGANQLQVFLNQGDGTFAAGVTYAAGGTNPTESLLADIDGDSDLDLITALTGSSAIAVRRNNGNGTFAAATTYATGGGPSSITVGNFDGIAGVDIAIANSSSGTFTTYSNNGSGGFITRRDHDEFGTSSPTAVQAFDIENDGLDDLIAVDVSSSSIRILQNWGDGSFSGFNGPSLFMLSDVEVTHLDADGNADLVGISESGAIGVFMGMGNGAFQSPTTYSVGGNLRSIALGDVTGDGRYDAIIADGSSGSVRIRTGNNDGTFNNTSTAEQTTLSFSSSGDGSLQIKHLDITTVERARTALNTVESRLSSVAADIGKLGSVLSRLATAQQNLLGLRENYIAAESRIRDIDVAQASSELIKESILQQVGAAVLANANQSPQLALVLLRSS